MNKPIDSNPTTPSQDALDATACAQQPTDNLSQEGTLFIVPTPIGNLADITHRAISVLQSVNAIACEDTRHSRVLLSHYAIDTATFALHDHNESSIAPKLIERLKKGEDIALISDAGTPLINDPGYSLVSQCRLQGANIVSLPGPCAAITALSAAGLATDQFHFYGFFPIKQGARQAQITQLNNNAFTSVFYEAPRRIRDTMAQCVEQLDDSITVVIAKELTKHFETFVSGNAAQCLAWLEEDERHQKGEFVLMFSGVAKAEDALPAEATQLMQLLLTELPTKKAAGMVAEHYGLKKNQLYQWALEQSK